MQKAAGLLTDRQREARRIPAAAGQAPLAERLLVVGLTGGIAAGKSTVAAWFAEWGAVWLDADRVAREVVEPGEPALAEIVRHFGREIMTGDGRLDRERLAESAFGSEQSRQALNRITHERIGRALRRRVEAIDRAAEAPLVVMIEAALLFEAGWDELVDRTVRVAAKQSTQLQRLKSRRGLDEPRARARVASQRSSASAARADHVIPTDGSLEASRTAAASVWALLENDANRKFEAAGARDAPAGAAA